MGAFCVIYNCTTPTVWRYQSTNNIIMSNKIRKNTLSTKASFYSGAITGLSLGLIASPIWWVVDTIAIILSTVGATFTGAANLLKRKEETTATEEPIIVDVDDIKDGKTSAA